MRKHDNDVERDEQDERPGREQRGAALDGLSSNRDPPWELRCEHRAHQQQHQRQRVENAVDRERCNR